MARHNGRSPDAQEPFAHPVFPRGANRSRPAVAAPYCRHMGDLILGAVLLWLAVFIAFGTNLVLRDGRRERVLGVSLIALGLLPCLIALWIGT